MKKSNKSAVNGSSGKVLLVGDVDSAFLDIEFISDKNCVVCASMLDAVDAVARDKYLAVGVVMQGISLPMMAKAVA